MNRMKKSAVVMMGLMGLGLALSALAADDSKKEDKKGGDKEFAQKASACGLAEVNLSQLAMRFGNAAAVKQFAQKMAADHMRANQELTQLANERSVALAKGMDDKHQKLYDKLKKLSGAEFDRAYIEAMVKDHEEAVKLFEAESKDGKDRAMKQWAEKLVPSLKHHLEGARKICEQTKGEKKKD